MKQRYRYWLNSSDQQKLKDKAESLGYQGKGWLGSLMFKIANEDFLFLDINARKFLSMLNLKPVIERRQK